MNKENCFELGHIVKAHGLNGFLTVFLDTDFPQDYYNIESVLLDIKGELIPFFIEEAKESSNPQKVHFRFEDINSVEEASKLIKTRIYLPETVLPELDTNQFYYHEVIGFDLEDVKNGTIGKIEKVYENTGNDFFAVNYNDKEVLIPIADAFIREVDKNKKRILVDLPEGLLDL